MDLSQLQPSLQNLPDSHNSLPQGIRPTLLVSQVRNTAPFVFEWKSKNLPYVNALLAADDLMDHGEYFRLCVSAHFASCATFVPTDVDVHIRYKLWNSAPTDDAILRMVEVAEECRHWDVRPVSARCVEVSGETLTGHQGEWFSVAVAAYARCRRRFPEVAARLRDQIDREYLRELDFCRSLRREGATIEALKAITIISHNFGDRMRVMDLWELPPEDPLRSGYGSEHEVKEIGRVYTELMASENHRHLPLRKPRCLRQDVDFLLPIGPFFDEWGRKIAMKLSPSDAGEVAEALVDGYYKLLLAQKPGIRRAVGYARALRGLCEGIRGGEGTVLKNLPSKYQKLFRTGALREDFSVPEIRFLAQWERMALKQLELLKSNDRS